MSRQILKMKAQVIFSVALWLTAYASSTTENADIFNLIQTENNEPEPIEEINLVNSDLEQKADEFNSSSESYNLVSNVDATMDIVIEENIQTPLNTLIPETSEVDLDEVAIADEEILYNDVVNRDPSEIMDTAAGFVPIPIIKRRQKPQKRYGLRRNFLRNPYRRYQPFYPYYYYRFYRPSSLRYFYY
ncbi:unnamed protein product [Colias eurytheme]|nr:unnamed protein product [Colias eurytheme]